MRVKLAFLAAALGVPLAVVLVVHPSSANPGATQYC